ncbi:MAG: glycosyl transferase [Oscillatoriales cyanobacterium CG2_30_44_21]|nr:MAG: glycosyl transferase [Oscillatoriales cyanobacterium CG2_30_44_21]
MPTLYTAITNHGFGHATRTASILADLQKRSPDIKLIIATTAPRWLLEEYIEGDFIYHPRVFDVGVVQVDSLVVDREATFAAWQKIFKEQLDMIAAEVKFLQEHQVNLIFGDIPPMIAVIAKSANIPCWMASNFGWDFIYRDWGGKFAELADRLSEAYNHCDRLFRLPFAEPMTAFKNIEDVGLTAANPKYTADYLRHKFNLECDRPTAMLTFGGLSLQSIPYDNLAKFADWQFITFDRNAPELPNLVKANIDRLRPVDLMVICDRIVTKPGYGTFAEALRAKVPVVCLTREGFLEAETLIAGVKNYAEHLIISPQDFYEGDWSFLKDTLHQPLLSSPESLALNGEETISQAILDYFK